MSFPFWKGIYFSGIQASSMQNVNYNPRIGRRYMYVGYDVHNNELPMFY